MKTQLKLLLLTGLLTSSHIFAQGQQSTTQMLEFPKKKVQQNTVMIDGVSILLKGFGIVYQYTLQNNLSVGGFFSTYKLSADEKDYLSSTETEAQFAKIGVLGYYYLTGTKSESGPYLNAGLETSNAKVTVTDSYYGEGSSSTSGVGALAKIGYQFTNQLNSNNQLLFQVGLGTGTQSQLKYQKYTGKNAKFSSGLTIDLNAGMDF